MKKLIIGILAMVFLTGNPVHAAKISAPEQELRTMVDRVLSILNDPELQDPANSQLRRDKVFETAIAVFDYKTLAMGALGSNWRRFSPEQQSRFTSSFSKLIAETYFSKMDGKTFDNITISYVGTEMLPSTKSGIERADVFTEIKQETVVTPVTYRMMKNSQGAWKIYDVKIQDLSMVSNYRDQYSKQFDVDPETLIRELEEKVKK